jgi:hypothetical protein
MELGTVFGFSLLFFSFSLFFSCPATSVISDALLLLLYSEYSISFVTLTLFIRRIKKGTVLIYYLATSVNIIPHFTLVENLE